MLVLDIPGSEFFDEDKEEFVETKPVSLRLEHSLVSVSKWEAEWKVPFLSAKTLTTEQTLDYIKFMTINQNVDPLVYSLLNNDHIKKVSDYISDNRTATTFSNANTPPNRQIVTSELIYFWMAQYNIPFECQKWHLSRLMTLIRIASIKNAPEKKMSQRAIMSQNKSLNAARRKAMHTKG